MQNMTDSRYGAWDYDELTQAKDSTVLGAYDDFAVDLDALIVIEVSVPTILVQEVRQFDGTVLFAGEVRFTDPDDLNTWLDEHFARVQ